MAHLANSDDRMIRLYDRLAPVYDRLHQRWLRYSGGEAQAALEAAVRVGLRPGSQLLDAGCGTGRFARGLLSDGVQPDQVTVLDPSVAMLARCADLPVKKVRGRIEALPCPDACFDIVTCAWVIETLTTPREAVEELCRVLQPGGLLCLTFCAEKPERRILDRIVQKRLAYCGTGRFLDIEKVEKSVRGAMSCDLRILPSAGPAATLIARRTRTGSSGTQGRALPDINI